MTVTVQFQRFSEHGNRPLDYAMNSEVIATDRAAGLPHVGDYIAFETEDDGEQGLFRVRTRFFIYSRRGDQWSAYLNIVVEDVDEEIGPQLMKE